MTEQSTFLSILLSPLNITMDINENKQNQIKLIKKEKGIRISIKVLLVDSRTSSS